ncbi:hypothetical protein LCGC14_3018200, partial [marine sediment metagenome]
PIPVRVVGWHKNRVKHQKWLRVKIDRHAAMWLTPEHKVWTTRGWVRADQLVVGDFTPHPKFGTDDLIHGTILGDANVQPRGTMQVLHSKKQSAWCLAKSYHLGATGRETKPSKLGGPGIQFNISVGKRWRSKFYPHGKKIFVAPPSPRAVAVWYCDDGSWNQWPPLKQRPDKAWATRSWKYGHGRATFSVQGFSESDQLKILSWASATYGPSVSLYRNKKHACYTQLVLKREARDSFFKAIAPYVHPSMQYKLPAIYRGQYDGWLERRRYQWTKIEKVEWSKNNEGWGAHRYCVTVDHPTRRFFTTTGLVSNCWHWLQSDLPKALGFVAPFYYVGPAWKHMASAEPAEYNALDNAITMTLY